MIRAIGEAANEAVINRAMVKVSKSGKTSVLTGIHILNDPSAQLPTKIGVGEEARIKFPIDQNCLLDAKPLRIGALDSFGRIRWAPKRGLIKAHRDLEEHKAGRRWY